MTSPFVLGVDLDGVVADFYGGLRPIAAEWLGVAGESLPEHVSYGFPEWHLEQAGGYEALHRFAVVHRNLFRELKPMEGAPATLRRLSATGIRIRIITHRLYIKHFHQQAVLQTITWLDHWGIPYWDLCFMRDKAAVGADLYIEDNPDNIAQLREEGHPTIIFTNSTNLQMTGLRAANWPEVESLVTSEYVQWKQQSGM
ncbi:MAG TPA: 5'-nucleotidase [Acidobacteriota bacterium]|nr:5'-nucleotidase [Acidobacteriota bacterium]